MSTHHDEVFLAYHVECVKDDAFRAWVECVALEVRHRDAWLAICGPKPKRKGRAR